MTGTVTIVFSRTEIFCSAVRKFCPCPVETNCHVSPPPLCHSCLRHPCLWWDQDFDPSPDVYTSEKTELGEEGSLITGGSFVDSAKCRYILDFDCYTKEKTRAANQFVAVLWDLQHTRLYFKLKYYNLHFKRNIVYLDISWFSILQIKKPKPYKTALRLFK